MKPVRLTTLTLVFVLLRVLPLAAQGNVDWSQEWKYLKPFSQPGHPMAWMNDSLSFTGLAYDEIRDVVYVVSPHLVNSGGVLLTEPRIYILDAASGIIRTDLGRSAHPARKGMGGELPVPLDTMNATPGGGFGFKQNKFCLYKIDVDDEGRIYACNLVNPLWGFCVLLPSGPCDPDYLNQGPFRVWRWDSLTASPKLIYATLDTTAGAIGDPQSSEMAFTRWGDAFTVTGKRGWYTPPGGGPAVLRDSARIYVSGVSWGGASSTGHRIAVLVQDTLPEAMRPDSDIPGGGKLSFRLGLTIHMPIIGNAANGIAPEPLLSAAGDVHRYIWINRNMGPVMRIEEFQSGAQPIPQTWIPPGTSLLSLPTSLTGQPGPLAFFRLQQFGQSYLVLADAVPATQLNPPGVNPFTTARVVGVTSPSNAYLVWGATPQTGDRPLEAIESGGAISDVDVKIYNYSPSQMPLVHLYVLMSGNGIAMYRSRENIPVALSAFGAVRSEAGVLVRWHVESEDQALLFRIQRAESRSGDFHTVGTVQARGTTTIPAWYDFTDELEGVPPTTSTLWYRLVEVGTDGSESEFPPVSVETGGVPIIRQMSVFPQPLDADAGVFSLRTENPVEQQVTLRLYDILGRMSTAPQRRVLPSGSSVLTVPFEALRPGQYVLDAAFEDGTHLRSRMILR